MKTFVSLKGAPHLCAAWLVLEGLVACSTEPSCSETRTCPPAAEPEPGAAGETFSPPPADTGGNSAVGGSTAGGSGGTAGTGGSTVDASGEAGLGGSAGAAAEPEGTVLGAPCDEPGSLTCPGPASESVLLCAEGVWTLSEACERGTLCDSTDPSCKAIAPGCERLAPGGAYCEENSRFVCGPDLVSLEEEACAGRCSGGQCVPADCGDGLVQDDEECDDGNDVDTDDCTSSCLEAACGDGFLFARQEDCDDGNDVDTDDCPSTCRKASCGDGFTNEDVEECDDANLIDTDACLSSCQAASCGDGVVFAKTEECDDGNDIDTDDCPTTCKDATCGDGFVWKNEEECDDDDTDAGDGCSSDCHAEPMVLSLGENHSCAILGGGDGRLKCWGDNSFGQVGLDTDPAVGDTPQDLGPNLPAILTGVTSVGAGAGHTCAIQGETVKCWGGNAYGQLGPAASGVSSSSKPVTIPTGGAALSVCSTGISSFALLRDKTVKGWGWTLTDAMIGAVVSAPFSEDVESIACGFHTVCAVLKSGDVECWGDSAYTAGDPPMKIVLSERSMAIVAEVAHGSRHACARDQKGAVRCWGVADRGQLGEGSTAVRSGDIALSEAWAPLELEPVRSLSSGQNASCVAFDGGTATCWGENSGGALGLPETTSVQDHLGDEPADGASLLPSIDIGHDELVKSIATSGSHTCAILRSGRLKCWGSNYGGQLGIGTTDDVIGDSESEMGDQLRYSNID
jgi:cysteine-rich repeat protein